MKKVLYLATTALLFAACTNDSYTINGTIEGIADGVKVYLNRAELADLIVIDSTTTYQGKFTFQGIQKEMAERYITFQTEEMSRPKLLDLFLESGNIDIVIGEEGSSVTGTPNNDIMQEIRDVETKISNQARIIIDSLSTNELSEDEYAEKVAQLEAMDKQATSFIIESIKKNITNPVGITLLKQNYYYMSFDELAEITSQIPAEYTNDEAIRLIMESIEKTKATSEGQKFTDFTMDTPEGKEVRLSDYVGKGKLVLIDFWASWCGPCRNANPSLVALYNDYKEKGFEIVGVSLDESKENWIKAIKEDGITWPQMSDLMRTPGEIAQIYVINSIPHTILVDGEGTIIARGLHGDQIREKVAEILK